MIALSVMILGEPVGEGRPRAFLRKGTRKIAMHAAPKSREWRQMAAKQLALAWGKPASTNVYAMEVIAVMPRPKTKPIAVSKDEWKAGKPIKRAQKPDVDNLLKSCMDALVDGAVIHDDTQIYRAVVTRYTATEGQGSSVKITLVEASSNV